MRETKIRKMADRAEAEETLEQEFTAYLLEKHAASNTVSVYCYAVRQFFQLYGEMNSDHLSLYKCYLLDHYKPQTVNLRIRALNCYLEFKKISCPKIGMIRIQQKKFLENVISQADYEYLKNCLIRDGNLTYYFIIRFMAATGVRVGELVQLTVGDVARGYCDIYSKGDKFRRIFIPKLLKTDALRWLSEIGRLRGRLFLNRKEAAITPAAIRGQLKKFTALYGLDPSVVYPHSFRHRFAKNFIEVCGDISLLADLLGHSSIETTRIYLHRSASEQRRIVNQVVSW